MGPIAAVAGLDNIEVLDATWLHIAGLTVTTIGIVVTIVAQYAMGESWRIGVDPSEHTDLVVDGPFRYARNPIFSAMLITATGLAMIIPNVVSIVGLLSLIAALRVQVRLVEEPYLLATHGDVYRSSAQSVGRFSPGMGHLD